MGGQSWSTAGWSLEVGDLKNILGEVEAPLIRLQGETCRAKLEAQREDATRGEASPRFKLKVLAVIDKGGINQSM